MLVRSRMTSHVRTVTPETTLAQALGITRAHGIRYLPVLHARRLVGLVSGRDLRLAVPPAWAADRDELLRALDERTVGEVMVQEIVTVRPDTPLEDAARALYTHRIGCLPVLDDGVLVGILTETDVLRAFTELFGDGAGSVRVEVQMPNRPGELARVMRLIGIEHRINIGGMVVPPMQGTPDCRVILKLQTETPQQIVAALRKIGYRVGSPSLETDPEVDAEPPSAGQPSIARAEGRPIYART